MTKLILCKNLAVPLTPHREKVPTQPPQREGVAKEFPLWGLGDFPARFPKPCRSFKSPDYLSRSINIRAFVAKR